MKHLLTLMIITIRYYILYDKNFTFFQIFIIFTNIFKKSYFSSFWHVDNENVWFFCFKSKGVRDSMYTTCAKKENSMLLP